MIASLLPDGADIEVQTLRRGRQLGRGGQGIVFELGGPHAGLVYKEYLTANADGAALKRLVDIPAAMPPAGRDRLLRQTAWPLARVMDGGRARGFVMQRIPDRFRGRAARSAVDRELQYLLYEPKPMWGGIKPPGSKGRLELARQIAALLQSLHEHALIAGDISMKNLLWAYGPPAEVFLIDCDGIRQLGHRPVYTQAETPDWDDPTRRARLDLDNDRYKCALLIGRVLSRTPYARPGDPLPLAEGIPDSIVRRVQALWLQASRGRGCRPHTSNWVLALTNQ